MRIIHLTSVHQLNDTRIALKMCASLSKKGYDVHLIGPESGIPEVAISPGITVHTVLPPKNRFDRITRVSKEVFRLGATLGGNIYHFNDPEGLRPARYWQKKLNRPFVYDVHEDYRTDILDKPWLHPWLRRFISITSAWQEDKITAQIAGVAAATSAIASRFPKHQRLITLQNFPLLNEFVNVTENREKKTGQFVYVGGIGSVRGAIEMVKAMELTDEPATLSLAGLFSDEALYGSCRSLPCWKRISYHGFMNRSEVARLFEQAIAGLMIYHPIKSHLAALPTKVFEYMSAGLPVIASDLPLLKEIITQTGCGLLVDHSNPKAIAQAMNHLMRNPKEAEEMGKRGREAVMKKYNWEAEFPKLVSLYEQLVNQIPF